MGYVPFNYIKKIEATTEQQVKFIDGAMEAIHLQATNAGGQYTHEQRLIMKRLVKHRSDVIKNASSEEKKTSARRRPAPAPPVPTGDAAESEKCLSVVGQSISPKSPPSKKIECPESVVSGGRQKQKTSSSKLRKNDPHRTSALSDVGRKEITSKETVKKSKSVTSSIGQAPSLVSSFSSNTSDLTTADSLTDASRTSDGSDENGIPYNMSDSHNFNSDVIEMEEGSYLSTAETDVGQGGENFNLGELHHNNKGHILPSLKLQETFCFNRESINSDSDSGLTLLTPSHVDFEENYQASENCSPFEDLPPPPPEIFSPSNEDNYSGDDGLPPAPCDLTPTEEILKMDDMYVSLNSDILELCGRRPLEECCCDDFQPKFDPKGTFFAQNSLVLPSARSVRVKNKERHDSKLASRIFASVLKNPDAAASQESLRKQQELLELAQVHCVQVTHADCEEMIGEFRKLTNLSHEESHWAILAVMNMLAAKVPHIRPSLEIVGMRFNLAHEIINIMSNGSTHLETLGETAARKTNSGKMSQMYSPPVKQPRPKASDKKSSSHILGMSYSEPKSKIRIMTKSLTKSVVSSPVDYKNHGPTGNIASHNESQTNVYCSLKKTVQTNILSDTNSAVHITKREYPPALTECNYNKRPNTITTLTELNQPKSLCLTTSKGVSVTKDVKEKHFDTAPQVPNFQAFKIQPKLKDNEITSKQFLTAGHINSDLFQFQQQTQVNTLTSRMGTVDRDMVKYGEMYFDGNYYAYFPSVNEMSSGGFCIPGPPSDYVSPNAVLPMTSYCPGASTFRAAHVIDQAMRIEAGQLRVNQASDLLNSSTVKTSHHHSHV
ncbi:hypothetical protein Btru_016754 [Bulinus truncatus]|nr:hypothetical protein Btru_016754 [Bulinus truncatus]